MFGNTYKFVSGGAAYTLEVGFEPTRIEVVNYTKFATDATVVKSQYFKGMAAGYSLNEITDDSGVNRSISTSNGFTLLETVAMTANYATITGITAANPGVVTTSAAHGFAAGDTVSFGPDIGGMTELNSVRAKILAVPSTTTFSIDVDTTAYTAFSAGTSVNQVIDVSKTVNAAGSYRVTLGTAVVGVDSDEMYVTCYSDSIRSDLGDIGA